MARFIPEKIYVKNILFEQGLSQCVITDIVQDKKGFIWASSFDGLNRFDGHNIKIYRHNPEDATSILSSKVYKLRTDESNHLYMNTASGFCIFDCEQEKIIAPTSIKDIHPDLFCYDSHNLIWLYSKSKGLFLVNTLNFKIAKQFPSFANKISGLIIDIIKHKEKLYIISDEAEILIYDTKLNKQSYFKKTFENAEIKVMNCGMDKYGNILLGSSQTDLLSFDIQKNTFEKSNFYKYSDKLIAVNGIKYNPFDDALLMSTYGQGLFIFDYSSNQLFQFKKNDPPLKLSNNYPISIAINNQGMIFIGYDGTGIDILDPYIKKFVPIIKEDPLDIQTLKFARKIIQGDNDDIYVGTSGNGVVKYNQRTKQCTFYSQKTNSKIADDFIIELLKNGNEIWLGYNNKGIGIFDINSFQFKKNILAGSKSTELSGGTIWSLIDDNNGNVWVGTRNSGLNKINKSTFEITQFNEITYPFFESNGIRTLKQKNENELLLGTEKGLYSFNIKTNQFKLLINNRSKKATDSLISIKSILIDKLGNIWLGTDGNGIIVLDKNYSVIRNFHANNFLKNNVIYAILPQNDSSFWISSNAGLANITWNENSLEQNGNIKVRNYDETNGLQSNEFNSGAYCLLRNGDMAFGGLNGLNIFNPNDIDNIPILPRVYINEFKVFENDLKNSKSISYLNEINLKHFENAISIGFSTLGFSFPEKTKYQYQLIGYDKDWIMAGNRNYVSYTNLQSGKYEFRVKACNYDGVWNENYASLKITIATPFYKTWWFITLSILFVSQLAFMFYRYRMKQIKEKEALRILYNKELAEVELKALRAQINPHFLFNSLNSINNFILKNDTKKASKYLVKFSQLVRNILNNSSSPLITLQEEINTIELYMLIEGMRFNEKFSYQILVSPSINTSTILIPSLLLQPYVENAIWHGLLHKEGDKQITISIEKLNEQSVSIEIKDNGVGRKIAEEIENKSQQRKSFGMQIGEDRLKLINQSSGQLAKVEVIDCYDNQKNAIGTIINIIIPAKIFREEN